MAGLQVQQLDEQRERNGDVNVALGHAVVEPVRHQHHADREEKGEGEHPAKYGFGMQSLYRYISYGS